MNKAGGGGPDVNGGGQVSRVNVGSMIEFIYSWQRRRPDVEQWPRHLAPVR